MKSLYSSRLFTATALLTLLWACGATAPGAPQAAQPANIVITTQNAGVGTVYLIGTFADRRFRVDSATVTTSGQAVAFQRQQPYPKGFYVAYYADKTAIQFLIDEDQDFSLTTDKNDPPATMKVEGSLVNELFYQSLVFEASQQNDFGTANNTIQSSSPGNPEYEAAKARQNELLAARKTFLNDIYSKHPDNFFVTFKRAGKNPEIRQDLILPDGSPDNEARVAAYRNEFWDGVDFSDTSLLYTPVINNKLTRYMNQLTPQRASAIIESADALMAKVMDAPKYYQFFANWITLKYEPGNTTLMDGEAVYVNMISKYFTKEKAVWTDSMTVYGLQQRASEMGQSLMGQKGPNITVPGIDGQPKTLYDLTAPYLIVYMYNPTCEHCIEQTPKLINFVRGRTDIQVYAIALDTEPEPWKKFVQQYGIQNWTNVFDPTSRSIYKTYYVDHTPELYLLNREREIIGKNLKASQIAEVIARDQAGK